MGLPEANRRPTVTIAETTWLESIVEVSSREIGNGIILQFILANGHRYAIPLIENVTLESVRKAVSRVPVYGSIPQNGHPGNH